MNTAHVIYTQGEFRIVRYVDENFTLEDLAGDCFEGDPAGMAKFALDVTDLGVFGFALERWNPEVGVGWCEEESVWGFVNVKNLDGTDHYIVDEFMKQIKE